MSQPTLQNVAPPEFGRFAELVEERLGIRTNDDDLRAVLKERVAATGAASVSTYLDRLENRQPSTESTVLANLLTIPETYFFRNTAHWKAFTEHVVPRIVETQNMEPADLRIWSAGCSTGEEPYTIAMVLTEMGLNQPVGAGCIVGTDLLEDSLAKARKATYGANSFRGVSEERISRGFRRSGDLLTVRKDISDAVTFRQLNLADATAVAAFIARNGPFHIIFCRNVLIYFTPHVCTRLLNQLADAVTKEGMLLLGHSEFPHMWTNTLESVSANGTFVWRKRPDAQAIRKTEAQSRAAGAHQAPIVRTLRDDTAPPGDGSSTSTRTAKHAPETAGLRAPTRAPDEPHEGDSDHHWRAVAQIIGCQKAGRSDEAFSLSHQLVEKNELLPEAQYALGLVLEEAGDTTGAINCYSRATFLDATFAHAHWRLALALGAWNLDGRAISEARWAVRVVASESDARIKYLSGIGRQDLTRMMEQTLKWLLEHKQPKPAFANS